MTRVKRILALLLLFFLLALTPGESEVPENIPAEVSEPKRADDVMTPLHYSAFGGQKIVTYHLQAR